MKKIMCIISVLMLSGSLYAGSAMAENAVSGDINGDGVSDSTDLNLVSDYVLGKIKFSENQYYSADMNGDGRVDSFDIVTIAKICLWQRVGFLTAGILLNLKTVSVITTSLRAEETMLTAQQEWDWALNMKLSEII